MRSIVITSRKVYLSLLFILLTFSLLLSFQYYATVIYSKPVSKPFEGKYFYNPYESYNPKTLKANFHAHSVAHYGLTNGSNTVEQVQSFYKEKGYDIATLSNYQKITVDRNNLNYIPVYEHGYNIKKVHQLVINAQHVSYFDFAALQGKNHKQEVISLLQHPSSIVAIAHPKFMNGYSAKDLVCLRGYKLMEVFTRYRPTTSLWDSVLTAGLPVWLLANDDTHDINRKGDAGRRWTRISSNGTSADSVVAALRRGCHYGVSNDALSHDLNSLISLKVIGNNIFLKMAGKADVIRFIGDGGVAIDEVYLTDSAHFKIPEHLTYVRVEVKTASETIILNPVIRYDGKSLPDVERIPAIKYVETTLTRLLYALVSSINLFLLLLYSSSFKRWLRQRVALPKIQWPGLNV